MSRRRRRRPGGKQIRDALIPALVRAARSRRLVPDAVIHRALEAARALGALVYHAPSHFQTVSDDMARLAHGRASEGVNVFGRFVRRHVFAARTYLDLHRGGLAAILPRMHFYDDTLGLLQGTLAEHRGAIMVVPHSATGVLCLAALSRRVPLTLLYRGPPNRHRDDLQRAFLAELGLEVVPVRTMTEQQVGRALISALRRGRYVTGATDLNRRNEGSIPATFLGQPVDLPGWPGRYAARRELPMVIATACAEGDRIGLKAVGPVFASDPEEATAAWAAPMERLVLRWPSDWTLLYDKRWSPVVRRAAAAARRGESQGLLACR